jgi:hypothetical protein
MVIKKQIVVPAFLICSVASIFTGIFWITHQTKKEPSPQENQQITQEDEPIQENTENTEEVAVTETFNAKLLGWAEATDSASWQDRDSHGAVVFKDKMWLMGGLDANKNLIKKGSVEYWKAQYFSDVWTSDNGKDWKLVTNSAPWGKRRSMQLVVFKDKMWVIGGWGPQIGYKNDVWYTEDGIKWVLATEHAAWPAIEGDQVVVFKDKMWLMGGVQYDKRITKNDVWYTEDGVKWVQATANAQWAPRWDHSIIVFKDKIWLAGGMDLKDNIYNDVWYSEDGINWFLATNNAPWQKRQGHGSVVFQDKLWVVGRFNDVFNKGNNDVWYTDDGINWTKTQTDPAWLGREDSTVLVFQGKIWVLGGMNSEWQWVNDIWYSTEN